MEFLQKRHVFAQTTEEAEEKFEAFNMMQMEKGFARMISVGTPIVDTDYVIA